LELLARKQMSPNGFIEERVAWWDSSDFAEQYARAREGRLRPMLK
jgi:hypothetical protein